MKKKENSKIKSHQIYKDNDGQRLPGVTSMTGILAKSALIHWAWQLGIDGIDYRKYTDILADIGTLAHYLIMAHIKKISLQEQQEVLKHYSSYDIDMAENCVLSYFEWEKGHKIELVIMEKPLVSEKHKFGGTPDLVCNLDGELSLLDFKTGKAIYPEHLYQIGGYSVLVKEHGFNIQQAKILRIGRSEDEGFEHQTIRGINLQDKEEIFLLLRKLYGRIRPVKNQWVRKKTNKGGENDRK